MGRIISIGNTSLRELRSEPRFDPIMGPSLTRTFEGSEEACRVAAAVLGAVAPSEAIQIDGPIWNCRVTLGNLDNGQNDDVAHDTWELDTEFIQEDFWMSPNIISACGSDAATATYKKRIETSIDERDDLTGFIQRFTAANNNAPPPDLAVELFTLRNRGDQATEVERKILRRVRTLQLRSALRSRLDAIPYVYSTGALIAQFGIDADIASLLPDDPSFAPTYTAWSWKKRADRLSIIAASGRSQEITDWVFSAWATRQYNLVV